MAKSNFEKLGINIPNYAREFKKNENCFKFVEFGNFKEKFKIFCIPVLSRKDLLFYQKVLNDNPEIKNIITEEKVKYFPYKERFLYQRIIVHEKVKGIHISFRPKTDDFFLLKSVFPDIEYIFISKSTLNTLSEASIKYLLENWKISIEVLSLWGFRFDLYHAVFEVEIMKKSN